MDFITWANLGTIAWYCGYTWIPLVRLWVDGAGQFQTQTFFAT